jgi:hypothetical protein
VRLGGIFDLDAKKIKILNEEEKTFDPNFWKYSNAAEVLLI